MSGPPYSWGLNTADSDRRDVALRETCPASTGRWSTTMEYDDGHVVSGFSRTVEVRLNADTTYFLLSMRQRVRPYLPVRGERLRTLAAFDEPRRAVAVGRPQAASFPSRLRIVNASVEALGVEAHRIRYAQHDHLAVLVRDHAVVQVAGRDRHVLAKAERVVLIDP